MIDIAFHSTMINLVALHFIDRLYNKRFILYIHDVRFITEKVALVVGKNIMKS